MKEFTVKENTGFRLRVKSQKCLRPADLNNVEFINECFDKNGEVDLVSTYQFFLSDEEIEILTKGLSS